jgi:hypothetical protein
MATKTISLELDAYEKLRRAKRSPRESFSSVVRRAVFPDAAYTAADLLSLMRRRMETDHVIVDAATLDRLDAAQERYRISPSKW